MARPFWRRAVLFAILAFSSWPVSPLHAEPWSVPEPSRLTVIQPVSQEKLSQSMRLIRRGSEAIGFSPAPHASTYRLGRPLSSQATAGEIYFPAKLDTYVVFGIFYNYNTATCAPGVTITASMVEQNGAAHGGIALNGTETVPVRGRQTICPKLHAKRPNGNKRGRQHAHPRP